MISPDSASEEPRIPSSVQLERAWNPLRRGDFVTEDLTRWLVVGAASFSKGGLAREAGRWLFSGHRFGFALKNLELTPKTRRIDGAIHLAIPQPFALRLWAQELADEALRLQLAWPREEIYERWLGDVELALMGLFHRRRMILAVGLDMEMRVECPESPSGGRKKTLTLMGALPFGGRIAVGTSGLLAEKRAVEGVCAGYASRLTTIRRDGDLWLAPA